VDRNTQDFNGDTNLKVTDWTSAPDTADMTEEEALTGWCVRIHTKTNAGTTLAVYQSLEINPFVGAFMFYSDTPSLGNLYRAISEWFQNSQAEELYENTLQVI
jgi:hypothetical protein